MKLRNWQMCHLQSLIMFFQKTCHKFSFEWFPLAFVLHFMPSLMPCYHFFFLSSKGRYAYVEFNTAAALQSLLQHTEQNGHKKAKNTEFIHSRFLTFSRAGKKKEKEKSVLNKQPVHRSLMNKLCQTDSVSFQLMPFINSTYYIQLARMYSSVERFLCII